jgi:hypothetical protein
VTNLLQETLDVLAKHGKTIGDVLWVGSRDGTYKEQWEDFVQQANCEYDDGYGSAEVAEDLVIVGNGWWLARWEYDGSEGWTFQTQPKFARSPIKPTTIFCYHYHHELSDIHAHLGD